MSARAAYPGTFDPFTPGHLDIAARARRIFDHLTVLVAVNADKHPAETVDARAAAVRRALPPDWTDVEVTGWAGLTAHYCRDNDIGCIVRGVRNPSDVRQEYALAAMNEHLGVTTLFLPARPELAAVSSTALRSSTR